MRGLTAIAIITVVAVVAAVATRAVVAGCAAVTAGAIYQSVSAAETKWEGGHVLLQLLQLWPSEMVSGDSIEI